MENATRLPKPPPYVSRGPFEWGAWDGALAMVQHLPDRFDTRTCERLITVRFATVGGKFPVPSIPDYDIGMPINVARPDLPYTQTSFKLGQLGNRRHIPMGGFSELHYFRIPVSLRDMTDDEHRALRRLLHEQRAVDARETKLSASVWKRLLSMSFADVQRGPVDEANEADRLLCRMGVDTCRDGVAEEGWREVRARGLYRETRNSRVQWIIPGKAV